MNLGYTGDDGVTLRLLASRAHSHRRQVLRHRQACPARDSLAVLPLVDPRGHGQQPEATVSSSAASGSTPFATTSPSFVYMRWGQNLSIQRKDGLIITTLGRTQVTSPADLLDLTPDQVPPRGRCAVVRRPYAGDCRSTRGVTEPPSTCSPASTTSRCPAARSATTSCRGSEKVGTISYSRKGRVMFRNAPPGVKVRGYHKRDGKVVERIDSR